MLTNLLARRSYFTNKRTTQILTLRPSSIASHVLQVPSLQSYLILMPVD